MVVESIDKVLGTISSAVPRWKEYIDASFLLKEMIEKYHDLLRTKLSVLKIT